MCHCDITGYNNSQHKNKSIMIRLYASHSVDYNKLLLYMKQSETERRVISDNVDIYVNF